MNVTVDTLRQHLHPLNDTAFDRLVRRASRARFVLLGEATHGTAEFYDMRARITRELVEKKGFNIVAVEADWPDAAVINRYIRGEDMKRPEDRAFERFPARL